MSYIFNTPHVDEIEMRKTAVELLSATTHDEFNPATLRRWTADHGCGMATCLAYEHLHRIGANASFLERFSRLPATAKCDGERFHVLIVPTMYYQEHPELGGDGRLVQEIAKKFGIECTVLEIGSLESISENATQLWNLFASCEHERIVLFSLSKGTADMKRMVLTENCEQLLGRIRGWVNISGMPAGTALTGAGRRTPVNNVFLKTWVRLRGGAATLLDELDDQHPYSTAELSIPEHIEVINIFGLPLQCHCRRPVDKTHAWLADYGPNDGYVLMEKSLLTPGLVVPIWGADHYLRVPEFCQNIYRVFQYYLSKENHHVW